jgi:hypothetical protein
MPAARKKNDRYRGHSSCRKFSPLPIIPGDPCAGNVFQFHVSTSRAEIFKNFRLTKPFLCGSKSRIVVFIVPRYSGTSSPVNASMKVTHQPLTPLPRHM